MRLFIALLISVSACTAAQAQELSPYMHARLFAPTARVELVNRVVRVPMRGTDHTGAGKCPYFQVYVNGRGPFTFLFDTGASYSVVSSKVAAAAGATVLIHRIRRDVVTLGELRLGGITLHDVVAIEDDNWGVDGIIGFATLGDLNVLFDLSRRELRASKSPIPMRRSFSVGYDAVFNVPTVPVQIGGRTVPLLLDTGDDAFGLELRSPELGDAALEGPPVAGPAVVNGATAQQTRRAVLKDPVKLGPVEAVHAPIAINDDLPVGDFGVAVLKQFRFQIEPGRHRVEFEPLFEGGRFDTDWPPVSPRT